MNKLFCVFALITFSGLLITGCSDKPITPVEANETNSSAVSLQKDSGPGAWIIRYEADYWFYFFYDEDAGLALTLGINDISKFCNYEGGFDMDNVKELYLPNADPNLRRMIDLEKAHDYTAMIWQTETDPSSGNLHDFICGHNPMATGLAHFTATDNDFYAWAQDHHNADSFGFKANGTLEGQDGELYKLNFVLRFVHHGNDDDGSSDKLEFKLQLVPTNK